MSATRTKSLQGRHGLLPPMHETSFSEQYMNFQAMGGHAVGGHKKPESFTGMPNDLDMTTHVKKIVQ